MQKLSKMKKLKPLPERTRQIHMRCSPQEVDAMKAQWKKSTCRTFSEYARKLLSAQPVVLTSRNLSLDNLIDGINGTRGQLAKLLENPRLSAEDRSQLLSLVLDLKKAFYQIAEICIPK
jgi:hypothetical protein